MFMTSTEMYDLRTGIWKEVGHLRFPRRDIKMVVVEDKILVMGGKDPLFNPHRIVEQFILSSQTWNLTTKIRQPRSYHAITTVPVAMFDCTASSD